MDAPPHWATPQSKRPKPSLQLTRLFRSIEDRRAERIVDNDRRLEIADFGRRAVALGDHLAPFGIVDPLGGLAALPQIATAAGAAFGVEQVIFANQASEALVFRRRALEQPGRSGGIEGRRQLETDNGGNHRQVLHALARMIEASR